MHVPITVVSPDFRKRAITIILRKLSSLWSCSDMMYSVLLTKAGCVTQWTAILNATYGRLSSSSLWPAWMLNYMHPTLCIQSQAIHSDVAVLVFTCSATQHTCTRYCDHGIVCSRAWYGHSEIIVCVSSAPVLNFSSHTVKCYGSLFRSAAHWTTMKNCLQQCLIQ